MIVLCGQKVSEVKYDCAVWSESICGKVQGFSYLTISGYRGRLSWKKQLATIQNWEKRAGETRVKPSKFGRFFAVSLQKFLLPVYVYDICANTEVRRN